MVVGLTSSTHGIFADLSFVYHAWIRCIQSSLMSLEFNRLPRQSDRIYDELVFANRLSFQFTLLEMRILMGLSRLHRTHLRALNKSVIATRTTGIWYDVGCNLP